MYCIGDIHGEFSAIGYWIKQHQLKNCDLIFLGDFGLGFDSLQKEINDLTPVNKICNEFNVDCYILRGNHDDPSYYNTDENKLNLSHIKPLEDYTIISFKEHNILCVGGAISLDRTYRHDSYMNYLLLYKLKHHCSDEVAEANVKLYHWENEGFKYSKQKINSINRLHIPIDIVCSHSSPKQCYPINNSRLDEWVSVDASLKKDVTNERENLAKLLETLQNYKNPIKAWYYGHYHEHHVEEIDGVKYTLLDMGRSSKNSTSSIGACFDMVEII
jgi:predicted phosphodiesterase